MCPKYVEFIAVWARSTAPVPARRESSCRSIGKEDPAEIPAPELPPILGRFSPPRAVRLPEFYTEMVWPGEGLVIEPTM